MNKYKKREIWTAFALISPGIILLIILCFYPIIETISFTTLDWKGLNEPDFIGIENYKTVFNDRTFWQSVFNTIRMAVFTVPIGIILSLIVAVAINSKIRFKRFYTTVYYLPVLTMTVAITLVWTYIFAPNYGVLNQIIEFFGGEKIYWFSDPKYAWIAISIITIWKTIGSNLLLFIAALQSISSEVYESVELDGCGPIRKFFKITIPLVSPTIFFVTIMNTIGMLQTFDTVYMAGGPTSPGIDSMRTIVYYFYQITFINFDRGLGSTVAVILMIMIAIVTGIQFLFEKRMVHYE